MAAIEIPEGYIGNLSPLENQKLQQFWSKLTEITGVKEQYSARPATGNGTGSPAAAATTTTAAATQDTNDKYGQSDAFTSYLASEPPAAIRRAFWAAIKNDNPDSLALRFLRARKWEVDKAVVMLVTMIQWREQENINNIVVRGDSGGIDPKVGKGEAHKNADEEGLILQYRIGKSFVRGLDINKRPVYIVKPVLHSQKTQTARAMELYILHTIESIRMLVKDPYDTACLIFDLTGFGLRNMDFPAVKFLIQVFEARYPETLGVILIHNAPWVFQGIWRIVRGWLDPVVASKIHFTSKAADLEAFIPRANLMTEYGGLDNYTYAYIEPCVEENDAMQDVARIQQLTAEREAIIEEFEKATVEWCCGMPAATATTTTAAAAAAAPISTTTNIADATIPSTCNGRSNGTITPTEEEGGEGREVVNGVAQLNGTKPASVAQAPAQRPQTPQSHKADEEEEGEVTERKRYAARMAIADRLAANYWLLDPHVRARNIYDRLGILSPTGEIDFAPKK